MNEIPLCACGEFYQSHHPECPARRAFERQDAEIARLKTKTEIDAITMDNFLRRIESLEADNTQLRAAMEDWESRIKTAGKRKCPCCYSIYCDIGIALAEDKT